MKNQHSIPKSITLHLAPGIVITLVFIAISQWTTLQNLPVPLALLFTWIVAGIPLELGILLYLGFMLNKRLSLKGVILYQDSVPRRQLIWLIPPLTVWALVILTLLTPLANSLRTLLFPMWPTSLLLTEFAQNLDQYSRSVLWLVALLSVLLNVLVPIVEELYFRGFLLPRMSSFNKWAPLVNITLFSLYHFWLPWEFLNRIIALFPMAYSVWRKRNILISIWVHVVINTLGSIGLVLFILNR